MYEDRLDRIEGKIDKIGDEIVGVRIIQASHNEILKEHMRRTEANEKIVDRLTKLVYISLFMLALGGAHNLGIIEKLIGLVA